MAIYITGDTHRDFGRFSSEAWPIGKALTKNDYVIIVGDFGGIWDVNDSKEEEKWARGWLGKKPWTTLFIDGNHENFDRLNAFPEKEMFGGVVGVTHKIHPIYHLKRGYVYTIDGVKFFAFGGGYSIDKMNRTPYISWWPQELPNQKEFQRGLDSLQKHNNKVDYILTHTCGQYDFEKLLSIFDLQPYDNDEIQLRHYLDVIKNDVEYKKWYCGHFHIDYSKFENIHFLYENIVSLGD